MSSEHQLCTFFLGGHLLGIEVEQVREVIRHQSITPVPLAPPAVAGLINLRGQIVTAIELRRCLGMPPREADKLAINVVIRANDRAISLLVDEIGDVLEVSPETFESPPDTVDKLDRALLAGVHKLEDRLLLVLDTHRVVAWALAPDAATQQTLTGS